MPAPLPLENGRLTGAQTDAYWRDGFLFPIEVLSGGEAAAARAELEAVERNWLDAGLPEPLNTYKRVNANLVIEMVAQIAADPRILDAVEAILGPDIMVYGAEFFIKEPRTKARVTMHQDLTYWGLGATSKMVTAWLALSPATPASGCMDFVPASHQNPILPHQDTFAEDNLLSRGQEIKVDVSDEEKTAIELMPGQMSLHHGLTIHGSGPNSSDDRRIGLVVRYVTPEVLQEVAERDYATLVRGADRVGNFINIAPARGNFAPASLEIFNEVRAARAQTLMKDAKGTNRMYA